MIRTSRSHKFAMMACVPCLVAVAPLWVSQAESAARIEPVEVGRLVAAMRAETGYDVAKTTQAGRFQGGVYLRLAASIPEHERPHTVLFIDHADWHQAYLTMADVGADEAPVFVRLQFENRQDVFIDARPGRVVQEAHEGAMATVFRVIGLASVKQVRMVVGSDGVTVVRANVKKLLFKVSATVIVQPDGRASRDVPQDRQDLLALERRLKKPLNLDYEPTDWETLVAAAYAQFSG